MYDTERDPLAIAKFLVIILHIVGRLSTEYFITCRFILSNADLLYEPTCEIYLYLLILLTLRWQRLLLYLSDSQSPTNCLAFNHRTCRGDIPGSPAGRDRDAYIQFVGLPRPWSCTMHARVTLAKAKRYGFCSKLYTFNELLEHYDDRLFSRMAFSNHCLHHLLEPDSSTSQMTLRVPVITRSSCQGFILIWLRSLLFLDRCMVLFSFYVKVFVENACACIKGCLQRHSSTELDWTQLNSTDPVEQRTAKGAFHWAFSGGSLAMHESPADRRYFLQWNARWRFPGG